MIFYKIHKLEMNKKVIDSAFKIDSSLKLTLHIRVCVLQ